jgi:hypothetical protein
MGKKCWLIHLNSLFLFPQDIQEKARKEVLDILGDGDDIVYPTAAQCTEFKYIYMIMKEVRNLTV